MLVATYNLDRRKIWKKKKKKKKKFGLDKNDELVAGSGNLVSESYNEGWELPFPFKPGFYPYFLLGLGRLNFDKLRWKTLAPPFFYSKPNNENNECSF